MIDPTLSPLAFADTARLGAEPTYRLLPLLREAMGLAPDEASRLNAPMAFVGVIAADLVRFGGKMPWAVKIAARIAERLVFDPGASHVHIEFHQNGASFTFTCDEAPDAARAAGPARFKLTFDLRAYRAVIDAALAERATAMGTDDVA